MRFPHTVFLLSFIYLTRFKTVIGNENELAKPLVTIPSLGQVRGSLMTSAGGRQFLAFRGIPYAKPPIGNLRFKDPLSVESWNGKILDGTKEGTTCVQYSGMLKQTIGVEDCLMLNIYTHSTDNVELKPVMVWIHGGGFMTGSGNGESKMTYYGPGYILDRDVVLVTINYRLAALGFLTTGDSEAPGNYGLLDQTLALKWVRDNIGHFGGNPKSVTIFGESAGGASVESHILSPRSNGLFDRAIIQSGSLTNPWALQQFDVEQYSKLLAEDLGCPLKTSRAMVYCLQKKDVKELFKFIHDRMMLGPSPLAYFGPRIDIERESPFLPDHPRTLVKEKRFNSVPIITGLTSNEGSYYVALLGLEDRKLLKQFVKDPVKYIPYLLEFELRNDRKEIASRINARYFNQEYDYQDQLVELEQMFSDYLFYQGIDELAHLYSEYSDQPVFYYEYAYYMGQFSFGKLMGLPPDLDQLLGVGHGAELLVQFSSSMFPLISDPNDIQVSKLVLDLWTSFAANGVPRSNLLLGNEWLPMRGKKTRYLKIQAEEPRMIHQSMPFRHRLRFWDNILESILKKDEL